MKYLKIIIMLVILLTFASTVFAGSSDEYIFSEPVEIRVLLSNDTNTIYFSVVVGEYELVEDSSGKAITEVHPGELWFIKNAGHSLKIGLEGKSYKNDIEGVLYLRPCDEDKNNIFRYSGTRYRGGLKIYPSGSKLLAVNVLDLEKYLYGVLGKEIGTTAKMEALKAQAVVSRTYALGKYNPENIYDVTIDTNTQVYGGYDAESLPGGERVVTAVDSTKGEVLFYNGKLVQAFFHSNSGGYTANSEDVWGGYIPYLRAVPSPFDSYAESYPVQTSSGWPGNTYHWKKSFTKGELLDRIQYWNDTHKAEEQIRVGKLLEIKPSMLSDGERVTQLDFIGSQGVKTFFRNNIRWVLGLRSTRFQLETNATCYILSGEGELVSTARGNELKAIAAGNQVQEIASGYNSYQVIGAGTERHLKKQFTEIYIDGYGYGHGLGMSQWGARGMAAQGYKYAEILQHYYNPEKKGTLELKSYYPLKEVENEN
ncbi:MAG: stage sporulation protein [Clostridia bacterium]|jgi:stage II sporulation protein D|nr:sporulation protein -like [Clostridiales bacterium]MDK2986274.1 stage sporulation protein [Clostridia bacterium]